MIISVFKVEKKNAGVFCIQNIEFVLISVFHTENKIIFFLFVSEKSKWMTMAKTQE